MRKNTDRSATRKTREDLKKAEKGDVSVEELAQAKGEAEASAASVEQEASDGPEGRGLTR